MNHLNDIAHLFNFRVNTLVAAMDEYIPEQSESLILIDIAMSFCKGLCDIHLKLDEIDGSPFLPVQDAEPDPAKQRHWITTESGSHILVNGNGEVVAGAGGKLAGKKFSVPSGSKDVSKHIETVEKIAQAGFEKHGGDKAEYLRMGRNKGSSAHFAREYEKKGLEGLPEGHLKEALIDRPDEIYLSDAEKVLNHWNQNKKDFSVFENENGTFSFNYPSLSKGSIEINKSAKFKTKALAEKAKKEELNLVKKIAKEENAEKELRAKGNVQYDDYKADYEKGFFTDAYGTFKSKPPTNDEITSKVKDLLDREQGLKNALVGYENRNQANKKSFEENARKIEKNKRDLQSAFKEMEFYEKQRGVNLMPNIIKEQEEQPNWGGRNPLGVFPVKKGETLNIMPLQNNIKEKMNENPALSDLKSLAEEYGEKLADNPAVNPSENWQPEQETEQQKRERLRLQAKEGNKRHVEQLAKEKAEHDKSLEYHELHENHGEIVKNWERRKNSAKEQVDYLEQNLDDKYLPARDKERLTSKLKEAKGYLNKIEQIKSDVESGRYPEKMAYDGFLSINDINSYESPTENWQENLNQLGDVGRGESVNSITQENYLNKKHIAGRLPELTETKKKLNEQMRMLNARIKDASSRIGGNANSLRLDKIKLQDTISSINRDLDDAKRAKSELKELEKMT